MKPKWLAKLRKSNPSVDPAELARTAEISLRETRKRQGLVDALTSYLDNRSGQNGFGEDFEITLVPSGGR